MTATRLNWLVVATSAAGILFILLGLITLAVPSAREGAQVWSLDSQHSVNLMDIAGVFVLGLGITLTWLGGKLWNHQLLT